MTPRQRDKIAATTQLSAAWPIPAKKSTAAPTIPFQCLRMRPITCVRRDHDLSTHEPLRALVSRVAVAPGGVRR
jgi:hypothetical protein